MFAGSRGFGSGFPFRCFPHGTVRRALAAFVIGALPIMALAEQARVSVDAIRIVQATPDFVEVELSGTQDGSMGQLCLGVVAKSKDGSVRSVGFAQAYVPADKQFRVLSRALRPVGSARQETDYLLALAYPCGYPVTLRRKFLWHYTWPERKPGFAPDGSEELAAAQPWQAFYSNLIDEDFAALDALLQNWNNPAVRDENGSWKLDSFRSVFVNYPEERRDWKGDLQRIQRWRAINPKSAGAVVAEAKYWVAYAWRIRGSETAPAADVDPVALKVFAERMQRAEDVLTAAKAFAADNPLWYEAYLDIAAATGRDDKFTGALFAEAVRRHPYYQTLYLDMAKRWASRLTQEADWEKADQVIRQAAANTAATDGSGNYAMLYVQLGELQKCECNLFEESRVSWPALRASFEDLVRRYPSADNLNAFAAFACRANDRAAFLNVRPRIESRILPGKWLGGYSHDLCDRRFMQSA